ncbi:MAG TPA: hypothetical protein H9877_02155, partial [Candidatus Gordonibacter avicola]|nr:hypothetical protein [Candidatus Gordonibacter avicola]
RSGPCRVIHRSGKPKPHQRESDSIDMSVQITPEHERFEHAYLSDTIGSLFSLTTTPEETVCLRDELLHAVAESAAAARQALASNSNQASPSEHAESPSSPPLP